MVFAIHWHESAMGVHLFPILRKLCRNESALLSMYQSVNTEFNPGVITGLRDRLNHFQDTVAHWWNHTSLSFEHGFALVILTIVFCSVQSLWCVSLVAQIVKNLPAILETWVQLWVPGGGHGNPLQHSCLENPHGQRSLVGYSPMWSQRVRHNWLTKYSKQ